MTKSHSSNMKLELSIFISIFLIDRTHNNNYTYCEKITMLIT